MTRDGQSLPDPGAIDVPSNRFLLHPLADRLVRPAIAAGITANMASLAGLAVGLLAALAYFRWPDPRLALLGWALMLCWHLFDGLDGRIARATGTATPFGRFLDGFADYGVFVVVHLALALSLADPVAGLLLALAAGAAHAVQSAFYEARRSRWIRRLEGRFAVAPRSVAGGLAERLYNRLEARLGHRATAFDERLATTHPDERNQLLGQWAKRALPVMRLLWLQSANARTHAILLACLAGDPRLAWWWELLALTPLALVCGLALDRAEDAVLASAGGASTQPVAGPPPAA